MSRCKEASTLHEQPDTQPDILIRQPVPDDGPAVLDLIRRSAFLDTNSLYCYLLLCTHFSTTSAVAVRDGQLAGVITAYVPPQHPDTLFVWQVAVDSSARGHGLASRMLDHILGRPGTLQIRFVEATVAADNKASRALFSSLARRFRASVQESVMFEREQFSPALQYTEYKLSIGPLVR
ncbi:MAG TPA: diaminobutyrate acetyltransferase [Pseudohongiella sp.]|nr:diaminobutyrate acetyltransferase [Pseudohongiella sp.]